MLQSPSVLEPDVTCTGRDVLEMYLVELPKCSVSYKSHLRLCLRSLESAVGVLH